MPMKAEDLEKNGLVQFPAIMGGVVPVVQARGVKPGELKFTGRSSPTSTSARYEVERPGDREAESRREAARQAITVVHRSDGSGTTFLWTNYLSKVSPDFKATVGEGTAVNGPPASAARATRASPPTCRRSTARSATSSTRTPSRTSSRYGQVQNKAGKFVRPTTTTFKAAPPAPTGSPSRHGRGAHRPAGRQSWPITGASFILMHAKQEKPETARKCSSSSTGRSRTARKMADELDYVPMPEPVVKQIQAAGRT
jgi:phosphate transport system substrate-binding protein